MTLTQIALWGGAAIVTLTAGTFLLPRHVQVERTAKVAAEPSAILALAASNDGYQKFNPYKTMDPNLKIELFGPQTGVGSGFKFDGKDGKGTSTVTAVTADRIEYLIDLGSMGQPKQTLKATATSGGSDVVWTMDADMGMNPIGRVVGLFLDGMMGKTLETGLANLSATLKNS